MEPKLSTFVTLLWMTTPFPYENFNRREVKLMTLKKRLREATRVLSFEKKKEEKKKRGVNKRFVMRKIERGVKKMKKLAKC